MSLVSQMASEKNTDMDPSLRWGDGVKGETYPLGFNNMSSHAEPPSIRSRRG